MKNGADVKILITGSKGKLRDVVLQALSPGSDSRVAAVPADSQLLEMTRSNSFDALIFTLNSKKEMKPLQWIHHQNRSLPLLAVLGKKNPKLREQLWDEGVAQVMEIQGLSAAQIRRELREKLLAARLGLVEIGRFHTKLLENFHDVRSVLTAILGNAELAARKFALPHKIDAELQEIIEGVNQVEGILRRIERHMRAPGASSPGSSPSLRNSPPRAPQKPV